MTEAIGIIGGSGLYRFADLQNHEEIEISTPYGAPSDKYLVGQIDDLRVVFLPRHGRGHRMLPSEINYAANIYGLKQLGVEKLFSVSAVGSLDENYKPGDLVVPDQFIDMTKGRRNSFFGDSIVGHTRMDEPVSTELAQLLKISAREVGAHCHDKATYVCIEGPTFSTRAESELFRQWKAQVIGMTSATEAKLAREAEMEYANLSMVTDFDAWHASASEMSADRIMETMKKNLAVSAETLLASIHKLKGRPLQSKYRGSMEFAIVTSKEVMKEDRRKELAPLYAAYL